MAVYTRLGPGALERFLEGYDLGPPLALEPIEEGVENSNWRLVTGAGRFILTVYEKRVRRQDLPFFLGLMTHLATRGIPCPLPVRGHDGEALRELEGKPAAIVGHLDGRGARRLTPGHCAATGAAMAMLHRAGEGFARRRPNDLALDGWRRLASACGADADRVEEGLAAEIAAEIGAIAAAWPEALPEGVIHADLFPDNVLFLGQRLSGVIDFYFACDGLLAYDLAIALNAWCFEPDHSFNVTKARALLEGYAQHRPLLAAEIEALPILARGAALRFLLTRLYDWLNRVEGALVRPKDPKEYLRKMRFHRAVGDPGAYGLG